MTEQTNPMLGRMDIVERALAVENVNYPQRIVTVVAAPYDQPATVMFQGEPWQEFIERGAWDAVTSNPHRVRVNREHQRGRTVGKVISMDPHHAEGLVCDIKIAKTPDGEETLELASDDCLSASVGMGLRPSDLRLDRTNRTRYVKSAYLDHIAFVESPAYEGARVLQVRGTEYSAELLESLLAAVKEYEERAKPPAGTPNLDLFSDDPILRWTAERLHK